MARIRFTRVMNNLPARHNLNLEAEGPRATLSLWLGSYALPLGFFALLTGMFWVGDRSLYHKLFYVSVALPAFLALLDRPALLKEFSYSPIGLPFLAFSAFTLVSIQWSGTDTDTWSLIKRPLYVLLLFIALITIERTRPQRIRQVLVAATVAAVISAAISLAMFLQVEDTRLQGHGALYNPLLTSHVFGFFMALAVATWIVQRRAFPLPTVAACALLGTVLLATGSRTPMVGISVTAMWLAALSNDRRGLAAVAVLAAVALLVAVWTPDLLVSRGLSYRPEIWNDALRQIKEAPIFGRGYEHPLQIHVEGISYPFTDPHNIVLAVLYDGGLVGLGLWLWLYGAAVFSCWQHRRQPIVFVCSAALIYGLAASMTEGRAFLSRPKEHWFLIWIPLALVTATTLASGARRAQKSSQLK